MSSSPTAKAVEKEHKANKEDNFSPLLRSIGWKEEWVTNRSEIVKVDELSNDSVIQRLHHILRARLQPL